MKKKIIESKPFYLVSSVGGSDTQFIVKGCYDKRGNKIILASDDSNIVFGAIDPKSSTKAESFSATKIVYNTDGTQTISGITRNLNPDNDGDPLSANISHGVGAEIILSNTAQFYGDFLNAGEDSTINGQFTFTKSPKSVNAVDDNDLITKLQAYNLLNGGNASLNSLVLSGVAGEAILKNQVLYFNETSQKWFLAKANSQAFVGKLLGIAMDNTSINQSMTNGVLIKGRLDGLSGLTTGALYADDNANISATQGTYSLEIGVILNATTMHFYGGDKLNLSVDEVSGVRGALGGSPSSTNPLISKNNILSDNIYSAKQLAHDGSFEFGKTNTTGFKNKLFQQFTANKTTLRNITLLKAGVPTLIPENTANNLAFYSFDNVLTDFLGKAGALTATGTSSFVADSSGSANSARYYGAGGTASRDNGTLATAIAGNFTIETKVNRQGIIATNSTIAEIGDFGANTGAGIWIKSSDQQIVLRINQIWDTQFLTGYILPTGVWKKLKMTYDGANVKFYVDDVLIFIRAYTTNPNSTTAVQIGARSSEGFYGYIEYVAITNSATQSIFTSGLLSDPIVKIYADNGSDMPDTATVLATKTLLASQWYDVLDQNELTFILDSAINTTIGSKYWIELSMTTANDTYFPSVRKSGSISALGLLKAWNSIDGYSNLTGNLYLKLEEALDNKVVGINYGGDGSDGALTVANGTTTTLNLGKIYNFTSINIALGGKVLWSGSGMAIMKSQGDIVIDGDIETTGVNLVETYYPTKTIILKSGSPMITSVVSPTGLGGAKVGSAGKGGDATTGSLGTAGQGGVAGADGNGGFNLYGGGGGGGQNGTAGSSTTNNNGGNGGAGGSSGGGAGGSGGGGLATGNGGNGADGATNGSGGAGQAGGNGGQSGSTGGNGGNGGNGSTGFGSGYRVYGGAGGLGGNGYTNGGNGGGSGNSQDWNGGWINGSDGARGGDALYGTGGTGGNGGQGSSSYGGNGAGGNGGRGGDSKYGTGGTGGAGASGSNQIVVGGRGGDGFTGGQGGSATGNATGSIGGRGGDGKAGATALLITGAGNISFTGYIKAFGGNGGNGGAGTTVGGQGGNGGNGADVVVMILGSVLKNTGYVSNQGGTAGTGGSGVSYGASGSAGKDGVKVLSKVILA